MAAVHSLKVGALAQTVPVVVGFGSYLLTTPFVVQALGIKAFGLWALTGGIAQYGAFLDLGVPRSVTRFVALHSAQGELEQERAIVGSGLLISGAQAALLVGLAVVFSNRLNRAIGVGDSHLTLILLLSSVAVLVTGSLGAVFCGASIGRGRVVASSFGLGFQRAAVAFAGVIGIVFSRTLATFAICSAIGGCVGLILILLLIAIDERTIVVGLPSRDTLRAIIPFGVKGQAGVLAELALFHSGKILAGVFVGPAAAAIYDLGTRLSFGARALSSAAVNVVTAHVTRSFAADGVEAARGGYKALVRKYIALTNFPLFLLAATSMSVIPLWLGASNHEIVLVTAVSAISAAVSMSSAASYSLAYAADAVGSLAVSLLAGSLLALALSVPLGYVVGLHGILIGLSTATAATALFQVALVQRELDIPFAEFANAAKGPFAVSIVSTAIAAPVGFLFQPTDRASAVLPFVASALVFCAVYGSLGKRFDYLPKVNVRSR